MPATLTPLITTTTTMATMAKTTTISSIPVRAIPVPNTNKLILAGPCIVLRTATVAEALRQERKLEAAITTTTNATSSSTTTNSSSSSTSTTAATLTHRTAASKTPQSPELLRCKRRADIGRLGFPEAKPASVSRRNARERNRVKLVNLGFETLREHVPNGKKNRKMSKVETLRSAVEYIRQMQQMLRDYDAETGSVTEKIIINIDDSDNTIGGGCSSSDEDTGLCGEVPLVLAPAGAATSVPDTIVADASTTTCVAPVVGSIGGCEKMIIDSVNNNNNNNNNSILNNNSIKVVNFNKNSISLASAGKNTCSNNTTKDVSNLNFINLLPAPALANAGSQTFTVFTLPFHQSLSQNLISDEIFISNSSIPQSPGILTSSGINALSGNITTFTNLQTLATLSGTRGISLSFTGPAQDLHQKQPQQQQQQQQQQQNISVSSTEQCHPGVTASVDQQEQQQQLLQHQHNEQHNHQQQMTMSLPDIPSGGSSNLSRLEEPKQHNTTLLCDATFLPHQQQQHQLSMMHHQMQQPMDQVPSPCLSTASSSPSETSSESSYEYYEALEGSLEEDLQDISNWITELCSAQDMQTHGDAEDTPDFLRQQEL